MTKRIDKRVSILQITSKLQINLVLHIFKEGLDVNEGKERCWCWRYVKGMGEEKPLEIADKEVVM